MVNKRLMSLKKIGIVATYQSRFRSGRGTTDPVLCLKEEIRNAQVNKNMLLKMEHLKRVS